MTWPMGDRERCRAVSGKRETAVRNRRTIAAEGERMPTLERVPRICGAAAVGLEIAQGGAGVLAGVVEAAGVSKEKSDIVASSRGAEEIAACLAKEARIPLVVTRSGERTLAYTSSGVHHLIEE